MPKWFFLFAVTCMALSGCAEVGAQHPMTSDTVGWWRVKMAGKNDVVIGRILAEDTAFLLLQTYRLDSLSIPKNAILRMRPMLASFGNPHAQRYFTATSGHGLRKGEMAYDNSFLFFNQISYGLSDRFALGAGFTYLFLFDGPLAYWLAPKFSIPIRKDRISLAIGGLHGQVFNSYEDEDYTFSAMYTQGTFGSRNANISLGAGLIASNGNWRIPVLSLAGTVRASHNFALLLESYTFGDSDDRILLFGSGLRVMGRRIAFDAGAVLTFDGFPGAYLTPWGSFHLVLGKPKP